MFDTTFDFTEINNSIVACLDSCQASHDQAVSELTTLENILGYGETVDVILRRVQQKVDMKADLCVQYNCALDCIDEVEALSPVNKEVLYQLWLLVEDQCPIDRYMHLMIYSHTQMLIDNDIQQLVIDPVLTIDQKKIVAYSLLDRFSRGLCI